MTEQERTSSAKARKAAPAPLQREMKSAFFDRDSGVTDADRDELDFFRHIPGRCSACGVSGLPTAHLGVRGKANIGLCKVCVRGLVKALEEGPDV